MTDQEQAHLKVLIVATSAYFGHQIPDNVLALYVEDLADLPFSEVVGAIKEVRRDPKTTRFPLPAIIRDRLQPAITDENEAIEATSRIISAVAKYGWTNPDRAKEYIGELGWRCVGLEGGWQRVCETLKDGNLGTFRAQVKSIALTQVKRSQAGITDEAPSLPGPRSSGGLVGFGDMLKQIEEKGKERE